jgi:hypothetical protein
MIEIFGKGKDFPSLHHSIIIPSGVKKLCDRRISEENILGHCCY